MDKMKSLEELFIIEYPSTLIFSNQVEDANGINFVSSSSKNNGIVGRVKINQKNKLYKKGSITVPLKGSVLIAFVQTEDFYVAHQIAVLVPKFNMDLQTKLFYCLCIRENTYKYNFGRQADKTLKNILVPSNVPKEFLDVDISKLVNISNKSLSEKYPSLEIRSWKYFSINDIFKFEKMKNISLSKHLDDNGRYNLLSSIDSNNGVTGKTNKDPHIGNVITYNNNGSIGLSYYQSQPFCATGDVTILNPLFNLNKYVGLFLVTILNSEKYRYNYGRKAGYERLNTMKIKLPSKPDGSPDFEFMENYIKSLPYSSSL